MSVLSAARLLLTIPSEYDRQRLDKVIVALIAKQGLSPSESQKFELSRARVQALLANGFLTLNGAKVDDASRKVRVGESYVLTVPPPQRAEPEPQNIELKIVYEDDDVVVVDKPVGLVVHPAPGNRDHTLVNALLAHCGTSLSGVGGIARPGIVHRLDKDTSGLIVVAKNDMAHHALSAQFADRSLSRTYHALVWGVPMQPVGSIDEPIARSTKDRKKMAISSKGKAALTYYRVIDNYGVASLVECKLATGRTHQIRVHMAHIKHPLVGDKTYGGRFFRVAKGDATRDLYAKGLKEFPRQALHAVGLRFIHPRTRKVVSFISKLPDDMRQLIKTMGKINR